MDREQIILALKSLNGDDMEVVLKAVKDHIEDKTDYPYLIGRVFGYPDTKVRQEIITNFKKAVGNMLDQLK